MPGPYTVLNARVKQKLATEADWLAISDELGVIFEGEQAFVYNESGIAVNFKIGDGTKKFSELPYFIAYYSGITNCKVLSYLTQTGNITVPTTFRNMSDLNSIILINNSGGDIDLSIGIADGGSEIGEITLPNGVTQLDAKYYFDSPQTVYFTGLTGKSFSLFILYYQLDEAPVVPPGGTPTPVNAILYGTLYAFYPMYSGHANIVWDFTSGLAKVGSGYEGGILMGTGGLDDLSDYYLKGYKSGDTIGGDSGANTKLIDFLNLPKMKINIPANSGGVSGGGGIKFEGANNNTVGAPLLKDDGTGFTIQNPFNTQPKSKTVLWYTGVPPTP